MAPEYPEFKPVTVEDRGFFEDFFRRFPPEVCELNFTNIFIWRGSEHPRWTVIDGALCVLVEPDFETPYFLPPVGGNVGLETVRVCLEIAPRISRAPEHLAGLCASAFRVEEDRDNADYVYRSRELAELKGKGFDGKRNRIRKFERSAVHEYVKPSREHFAGCRRLAAAWFADRDANGRPGFLAAAEQAVVEAMTAYEALGLHCGAALVDGKVAAFTVASSLNRDTAVVHFEIADRSYPGLAQWLNREFVRRELQGYEFINREQDMGLPGLRRAKLSYYPERLVRKFNISRPA